MIKNFRIFSLAIVIAKVFVIVYLALTNLQKLSLFS